MTMKERKPSKNGFLQVQALRENNGEKSATSIDCCKYPRNILLDEFSMGFLDERKRLVVDSGDRKIFVPHSNPKLNNSHLFGAQNLNILKSLYFLENFCRTFAYAHLWHELAILVWYQSFLPIGQSFNVFQGWGGDQRTKIIQL